jgi:hypothetical protein
MIARSGRLAAWFVVAAALTASCANPFAPQYEYEEQVYLSVDGRATVVVDTSLPALVALRGAAIDPSLNGSTDRAAIRRVFEAAGCRVDNVSRFWTRQGRRFAQIQVSADDLRQLSGCGLLAWSSYSLTSIEGGGLRYQQTVGAAAAADPGAVNWSGNELVAFKLHLPSRIREHNVKRLDGTNGTIERGNILTWAQTLADRRAGRPVVIDVKLDGTSILHTTLWLFGGAFAAAVAVLALAIWLTIRRGRKTIWGRPGSEQQK